jgi:quercetin dioxygenase-like cupin family protein
MYRGLFILLLVLAVAPCVLAQDPVKVDSKHYTVEFENARVRVLRVKYGSHEKSVMHWHPAGIAIFQTDANVRFTFPNGKTEDRPGKAGNAIWTAAGRHLPENLGDEPFEVILVELKSGRKKPKAAGTAPSKTATPTTKQ